MNPTQITFLEIMYQELLKNNLNPNYGQDANPGCWCESPGLCTPAIRGDHLPRSPAWFINTVCESVKRNAVVNNSCAEKSRKSLSMYIPYIIFCSYFTNCHVTVLINQTSAETCFIVGFTVGVHWITLNKCA